MEPLVAPQRDHQLIIDVICNTTRCCRNAHNETCSISRKVVVTVTTVPGSGRGRPLAVLTQSDVQTKRVAQSLHLHLEETPKKKEFVIFLCPQSIAAHFPFEQIEPQIYMFFVLGQPLCSLNQILLIVIVNCFINRQARSAHSGIRCVKKSMKN